MEGETDETRKEERQEAIGQSIARRGGVQPDCVKSEVGGEDSMTDHEGPESAGGVNDCDAERLRLLLNALMLDCSAS